MADQSEPQSLVSEIYPTTTGWKPWTWDYRGNIPDRLIKRTTGVEYGVFAIHRSGLYINHPQQSFYSWKQVLQQFVIVTGSTMQCAGVPKSGHGGLKHR